MSRTHIAFIHADALWLVDKRGGMARRIALPAGPKLVPRFSPDGQRIALSANMDGSASLYIVDASDSLRRVTHHSSADVLQQWTPDGRGLLFVSLRESADGLSSGVYTVAERGGLPTRIPNVVGRFGALSPDGNMLAVAGDPPPAFRGYRGGLSPRITLIDLRTREARGIPGPPANDMSPMWRGRILYFLSDRGTAARFNLWSYETTSGVLRQLTSYNDFDVMGPSIGPDDIVFTRAGQLHRLDLNTGRVVAVDVQVASPPADPSERSVDAFAGSAIPSPDGRRAIVEARGDLFIIPADSGPVVNLTRSPGVAERTPAWSPDGTQVAYWSDRDGEYQLFLHPVDGDAPARQVTRFTSGFRYRPFWSPDGTRIAFIDEDLAVNLLDLQTGRTTVVDRQRALTEFPRRNFPLRWSGDGQWLAYAKQLPSWSSAIAIYHAPSGTRTQLTSGQFDDSSPTFDLTGCMLYYLSRRSLRPVYGTGVAFINSTRLVGVPLRVGAVQSDSAGNRRCVASDAPRWSIDTTDFERRAIVLPAAAGNYAELQGVADGITYRRLASTGVAAPPATVRFSHVTWTERPAMDGSVPRVAGLRAPVDRRAEWRQVFDDVWRIQRDMFYDSTMHGVDWRSIRSRYRPLVDVVATRNDLNTVLSSMLAELRSSHMVVNGGDMVRFAPRNVGLLGVDWRLENGAYRIAHIVEGAPWDLDVQNPLRAPGVDVREGDYVLAVDGKPIDTTREPAASFVGTAGRDIALTVSSGPDGAGARTVRVRPIRDEVRLRQLEWIERNRRRVDELSRGRVGYVYVSNTSDDGIAETIRMTLAQNDKAALLVDARYNPGGDSPTWLLDLFSRPRLGAFAVRAGSDWQARSMHAGPTALLVSGRTGSSGDGLAYYFKLGKLGPIVGTATQGALIGQSGAPSLIDGGFVSAPSFRLYGPDGKWFPEGVGVLPDIRVESSATDAMQDAQLSRGVAELLRMLQQAPPTPRRPPPTILPPD